MNAHADLNLRWAYISEGTFSDVAAHSICLSFLKGCDVYFKDGIFAVYANYHGFAGRKHTVPADVKGLKVMAKLTEMSYSLDPKFISDATSENVPPSSENSDQFAHLHI